MAARLSPAVARIRNAVRAQLSDLPANAVVLVACSGGPDSAALAAAGAFVAPRMGLRAGLVTVDHGLQEGSAARADDVAAWARGQGFDPVEVATVTVDSRAGGPEGAARQARYRALDSAASRYAAPAVLLGHTRNDQAETVLLALARGSGPRGIAAMPARGGLYRRPLLDITRADTERACAAQDLPVWHDPHNADPAYLRSGLRAAMPQLTFALGERFIANLAHTAALVADDNAALDDAALRLRAVATAPEGLRVEPLAQAHRAIRTRALRAWVLEAGARADGMSRVHIAALDALVTDYHGQGPVDLPGGITARRRGKLLVTSGRSRA